MAPAPSFPTAQVAVSGFILILSLPAIVRLVKRSPPPDNQTSHGLYEDADGAATAESVALYSTRRSFIFVLLATATGLITSFAQAVLAVVVQRQFSLPTIESWLLFAAWILVLVQILDTAREARPVTKFNRAILNTVSCFLVIVLAWIGPLFASNNPIVVTAATLTQMLTAFLIVCTLFTIDRRPDVYLPNGRLVERQYKGSLLAWLTISWCTDLLDMAGSKSIEIEDLPALPAIARSKDRTTVFRASPLKPTVALWKLLMWAFRFELFVQWPLITCSGLLDVAPQYSIMRLLQYLEARQNSEPIDPRAWLWVGTLLATTLIASFLQSRLMWLLWTHFVIPLRAVLTTLIFEKMMKIKDCQGPPKPEDKESKESAAVNESPNKGPNGNDGPTTAAPKSEDSKGASPQTQNDITNMFTVDVNQVANFGANSQNYIYFITRLIICIAFLWALVGWQSLFAGLAAMVVMIPINSFLAKRYKLNQKALMKVRDSKTKVITEALHGIRQIKFSGTESQWLEKIYAVRNEELEKLWNTMRNNLYMSLASQCGPPLLTAFALSTYAYIYGELLPSVAFTAVGVFMQLEGILGFIPILLVMGIHAKVSVDRIDSFLQADERPDITYPGDSITFNKACISFPSDSKDDKDDRFVLRDVTLEFPNGALSVISGPIGSGKSLLLAAILGETELLSGNIRVPKSPTHGQRYDDLATAADWIIPSAIAFVSQTPWIENATIRKNILFGLPHDQIRYDKVLKACALTKDLSILEDGDETEVGAQGITLSGGQKWRLTLARALYSRAGILVLDDVFSALDAHVGKEIYDNALMGELAQGRTRILVTHHLLLCLPRAKYAVGLSAYGSVEYAGLVEQLLESGKLEKMILAEEKAESNEPENDAVPNTTANNEANGSNTDPSAKLDTKQSPKKLVEDEKREVGRVKSSVYLSYIKATGGFPFWLFVLIFYATAQGLYLGRSWWIKIWTSSYDQSEGIRNPLAHAYSMQTQLFAAAHNATTFTTLVSGEHNLGYYLGAYVGISTISSLVATSRYLLLYTGSLRASRRVFKDMTNRVLRTPLRWLDTVPTGRILNRFTADFQAMDSALANELSSTGANFAQMFGIMVAAFFVSPYIIVLAMILFAACSYIARRYLRGARSFKRLQSVQRSPMITHFSTSLQGLGTIRAFSKSEVFTTRMQTLVDNFTTCAWHSALFNQWLGLRMAMFGSTFSSVVAAFIVSTPGVTSGLAGFALAFAMQYKGVVVQSVRQIAEVELSMNAAERIFEYTELQTESEGGEGNLRASWPEEGKLEVKDLEVGYAEGLPSILKGLTFTARATERIGVVGRTGAGKSTLSLALFRFLDARKGSISIDGIDISTIKLHDLRTRLAIIPQDPVIFSGTIRLNLDPFDQFSDYELQEALRRVHLIPSADNTPIPELSSTSTPRDSVTATSDTIAPPSSTTKENINIFLSLSSPISKSGANISHGERQLLCLARSMLSRPKVLLLDEATSSVDMATDALIQRSIREEFSNTTLLVIAHRLSTVADFDKILVMADGVAAEFGSPKELLQIEDGIFKSMVGQSGEKEALERTILGGN